MSTKTLRPYQQKAIKECWQALIESDAPVLLMASVGAGKSLMLANILLKMQGIGKKSLCLVNNAELVRNNCATFIHEGGEGSIYCAALNEKDTSAPVVFGTPQSVLNGIKNDDLIATIKFNLIVVDEAHNINYLSDKTCFMRILRHYKQSYDKMRLLGATGTNFRFKGTPIVGEKSLFKKQVGNITTEALIKEGYLIKPGFEIDPSLVLDFSHVKVKPTGQFDSKELAEVVGKSTRLTELICKQIIHIMATKNRFGVFLFATTKKHAHEIFSHLPKEKSAIILGETPQNERFEILEKARRGDITYLVNISIISVGVDVPSFDTIAYLRPTESLVLLVQTMGRVLRLSPDTHKKEALVLDFAGNIERHRDWDNPIIEDAVAQTIDKDKPLVISCPACNQMNTEHARRCIGKKEEGRCDYYFEFKACTNCETKNDIAARFCRTCERELIDPNKKLSLSKVQGKIIEVKVIEARYAISGTQKYFRVSCLYKCEAKSGKKGLVFESYAPISDRAKRTFYGQFIKKHCVKAGIWYAHLDKRDKIEEMLETAGTPVKLLVAKEYGALKIKKKIFADALS